MSDRDIQNIIFGAIVGFCLTFQSYPNLDFNIHNQKVNEALLIATIIILVFNNLIPKTNK